MKISAIILVSVIFASACTTQSQQSGLKEFEDLCKSNGHMWMEMEEMRDGEFAGDMCFGCMSDNENHICDMEEYKEFITDGHVMEHNAMIAHAGNKDSVDIHFYRVIFVRPDAQSGKESELTFTINELDSGKAVSDLEIVHDKIMHVVLVRNNLRYFDHIHPQMISEGRFSVPYTFSVPGTYRIWIDFTIDGMQHIIDFDLDVSGSVQLEEQNMLNGLNVVMDAPKEITAGKETELTFTVTDAGKPVPITEKFLAANAHLIAIDETLQEFGHNHDEDFDKDNVISFMHKFTKSGKHKLWVQFIANGKETTAGFDLTVK